MQGPRIDIPTTEDIQREIAIAAELRGMDVPSLVNSVLLDAIRKEREYNPVIFRKAAWNATLAKQFPPNPADQGENIGETQTVGVLKEPAK